MITRSVAPPTATSSPSRPDDILATLCHDLRTPLAVISGTAQLLARQVKAAKTDPAVFAHELARITRNANRIAVLLDELCDLAHDGAGRPPALTLRPTDLVALTRRVVDEHRVIADGHTIAVASDWTAVVGIWDEARLERALTNLLANAVKYSPRGGTIVVRVRGAEDESASGWVELAVEDRGVGIPAADLPHVFERFHRGSNVVGRMPGAGIGLASVRAIVERHGGTVAIASVEGRGTTVTVRLPLRPPDYV